MTFPTSIQTYNGLHTGLGNTGNGQCTPDWMRGYIYIHSTNTNPGSNGGYVSQSQILGGVETGYILRSSLDDAVQHVSLQPPSALKSDGNLFMSTKDGMCWIDTTAWTRNQTWGEFTSPPYIFGPPAPPISIGSNDAVISGKMCAITSATKNYVYGTGLGSVSPVAHQTFLCNLPTYTNGFTWPGRTVYICSGADLSGDFWLLCGNNDASLGFFPLNIYHMTVDDSGTYTNTLIASVNPTDIDATWSFIGAAGVAYDQTDGNLLAFVQGNIGSPYLVKFDSATGAIIWQTIITVHGSLPAGQMQYSVIKNGIYCFILSGGPVTIFTVNTNDGTYTTQTTGVGGLTPFGVQCFNSDLGAIILNTAWNAAADGPVGLGGSTPGFAGWATLYVASPPPGPSIKSYVRVWGRFQ